MRQIKLISGKMNVPYIRCKPGYAEGASKPKRIKKTQEVSIFNPPVLCITLRKAA